MKKIPFGLSLVYFIAMAVIMFVGISIKNIFVIETNLFNEEFIEKNSFEVQESDNPLNMIKLIDNKEVYNEDKDSHVDKLYVTVLPPKDKQTVSFEELNKINKDGGEDYMADIDQVAHIIFQSNEPIESIPIEANATIELRGQSARLFPEKSYKIKLFEDTEKWLDFETINLNKHYADSLRIRNKLSYDYFEKLNDFVSLRTRFVRLYIKDLSSGKTSFKDYGLYTFVEQPNKSFLKRHGLDQNAHLYKVENFEFYRYADKIKMKSDPTYDVDKFEEILEIRGNDDHQKLIDMLKAINDYDKDINEVVDQYFDRDNLMTWLAVNILFNNYDTASRNFLLYSPLNADKWFFIPWDYDKAWTDTPYKGKWQQGLANYWGMVIFNRFFKDPNNIDQLSLKIEELSSTLIKEENTRKLLDDYGIVVKEHILKLPDSQYLKYKPSEYKEVYNALPALTEKNKRYYYESLENPMPFFLGEATYGDKGYTFVWQASYDIDGDEITYDFLISKDPEFKNKVAEFINLKNTSCTVESLENGKYYWKVIARDAKGYWQEAFDNYLDGGHIITGTKKLRINNENE